MGGRFGGSFVPSFCRSGGGDDGDKLEHPGFDVNPYNTSEDDGTRTRNHRIDSRLLATPQLLISD